MAYKNTYIPLSHPAAVIGWRRSRGLQVQISEHRLVLYQLIGLGPHRCHWCAACINWGKGLRAGRLTVDHLNGDVSDNRQENLVAACNGCNSIRGRSWRPSIQEDEPTVATSDGGRVRAARMKCKWCGEKFFGQVVRKRRAGDNYCSRSCSGRAGAAARWGPKGD